MNLRNFFFTLSVLISLHSFCQTGLRVNGKPINNTHCEEIKNAKLDSIQQERKDILEANIFDNCLELRLIYGGCDANLELVTDGNIINETNPKLVFAINWIERTNCQALIRFYVSFDLSPYKKIIQENKAIISILGTDIQLKYKN